MSRIVVTHVLMQSSTGAGAIRLALIEQPELLNAHGQGEGRAVVALFGGLESTRLLKPAERHVTSSDLWFGTREKIIDAYRPDWEVIELRHGAYATRQSFDVALGGGAAEILGEDFNDAYAFLAQVTGSSGITLRRASDLNYYWEKAYGPLAYRATRTQRLLRSPFAVLADLAAVPPSCPSQPLRVTTLMIEERFEACFRKVIVENNGRLRPDGRLVTTSVAVGLRGTSGFSRFYRDVNELSAFDWHACKARMLREVSQRATHSLVEDVYPDRSAFVDAVGPRLIRALGGHSSLELLAPKEVPLSPLRLPSPAKRTEAAVVEADAYDDDPMFGAF